MDNLTTNSDRSKELQAYPLQLLLEMVATIPSKATLQKERNHGKGDM